MISKDLLKVIGCPKCRNKVNEKTLFLLCPNCHTAYPILNQNVPDLLPEDAWNEAKAEKAKFRHKL